MPERRRKSMAEHAEVGVPQALCNGMDTRSANSVVTNVHPGGAAFMWRAESGVHLATRVS